MQESSWIIQYSVHLFPWYSCVLPQLVCVCVCVYRPPPPSPSPSLPIPPRLNCVECEDSSSAQSTKWPDKISTELFCTGRAFCCHFYFGHEATGAYVLHLLLPCLATQEEINLAARRVSLAPVNRANIQSRSMSWRNGSLHWGRIGNEGTLWLLNAVAFFFFFLLSESLSFTLWVISASVLLFKLIVLFHS